MLRRAVFLDRDGTLMEERNYLSDPAQVRLLDGVASALKRLSDQGYALIVVSNQSGVARGYFTENDVLAVNAELKRQLLQANVSLSGCYFCPHHPQGTVKQYATACECRKPNAGLLLQAARDYEIDLKNSWVVGDKRSDVLTGNSLGIRGVLVKTGYGTAESLNCPPDIWQVDSLTEAAEHIMRMG